MIDEAGRLVQELMEALDIDPSMEGRVLRIVRRHERLSAKDKRRLRQIARSIAKANPGQEPKGTVH